MHLQCLPIKNRCAVYIDDPIPNIVYMAIRMPVCITMQPYSVVLFGSFFFCQVCGLLDKNNLNNVIHKGTWGIDYIISITHG